MPEIPVFSLVAFLRGWWRVLYISAILTYYVAIFAYGNQKLWYVHIYPVVYFILVDIVILLKQERKEKEEKEANRREKKEGMQKLIEQTVKLKEKCREGYTKHSNHYLEIQNLRNETTAYFNKNNEGVLAELVDKKFNPIKREPVEVGAGKNWEDALEDIEKFLRKQLEILEA